ncbi:MAG: hypothetical protein GY765_38330 [bacterium]|nr:hypothetical protein [bacterium]
MKTRIIIILLIIFICIVIPATLLFSATPPTEQLLSTVPQGIFPPVINPRGSAFPWPHIVHNEGSIVMDFSGRILKKTYLPTGSDHYYIYDEKSYRLKENQDTQQWSLHVENI